MNPIWLCCRALHDAGAAAIRISRCLILFFHLIALVLRQLVIEVNGFCGDRKHRRVGIVLALYRLSDVVGLMEQAIADEVSPPAAFFMMQIMSLLILSG